MKRTFRPVLFAALALSASTMSLFAQGPGPQGPPDGPPPHHGPPPGGPLFDALDANHDGVISADEIANASAALVKLAGTSGQITRDSLRPPPPDRQARPTDADPQGRPEHRLHPDRREAADDGPNPPPDGPPPGHHGPPPERNRPQVATDPAASPSATASPGPDEQGRHHGPPPGGPLFDALDTNHDGVISADEMANAATALKALDKNGDGQLTREELRPAGPPPPPAPGN